MSRHRSSGPLNLVCHPYLFALKEGLEISENLLDYNLLLLQRNCAEVLKSPPKKTSLSKTNLREHTLFPLKREG